MIRFASGGGCHAASIAALTAAQQGTPKSAVNSTGSFSWRVATVEITWSEQAYRIFEFDRGVPVTLDLIASRVHPEDIPSLHDIIDRARGDSSDFEYEQPGWQPRPAGYFRRSRNGTAATIVSSLTGSRRWRLWDRGRDTRKIQREDERLAARLAA
jgi:hypothetical protein